MVQSRIKEWLLLFSLFSLGISSRLPFLEKMQSHWDGPDYALALLRYSFAQQTPSPPGYPLYIAIGNLFHIFLADPHSAILGVSVLFSGIGVVVFYSVGKLIFNRTVGFIAAILFLSAPTIFYFGITANPYGALPATSALVAGIVYLIVLKKKNYGFLLAIAFSFAIGFRPQDVLFLLPLFLFGIYFLNKNQRSIVFIAFLISFFLWFLPMAHAVGGISEYLKYIQFTTSVADVHFTVNRIFSIWFIIIKGLFLTIGIAGVFLCFYVTKIPFIKGYNKGLFQSKRLLLIILFFIIWIIPSLFFNIFVRSDHAAHQMTYLSAIIFLTALAIWKSTKNHPRVFLMVLVVVVTFNLITFFRDRDPENIKPYVSQSYHYSELQKNNTRMKGIVSYITSEYSPQETIILVDPEIFRPVMYYLKRYPVYSYSSLDTNILPYANALHFGYNWNYKIERDTTHIFTVPQKVKTVICIPNNKTYVFQVRNVKKVILQGNAFLYIFTVAPKSRYAFSVHTIKQLE